MSPTDVMEAVTHYLAANRDNGQDAKVIANHCLPWLDQTPIDGVWLASINWGPVGNTWYSNTADTTDKSVPVVFWVAVDGSIRVGGLKEWQITNATRGQLLMLLTALGVTTCQTS